MRISPLFSDSLTANAAQAPNSAARAAASIPRFFADICGALKLFVNVATIRSDAF
jgi:hypothetical protein